MIPGPFVLWTIENGHSSIPAETIRAIRATAPGPADGDTPAHPSAGGGAKRGRRRSPPGRVRPGGDCSPTSPGSMPGATPARVSRSWTAGRVPGEVRRGVGYPSPENSGEQRSGSEPAQSQQSGCTPRSQDGAPPPSGIKGLLAYGQVPFGARGGPSLDWPPGTPPRFLFLSGHYCPRFVEGIIDGVILHSKLCDPNFSVAQFSRTAL